MGIGPGEHKGTGRARPPTAPEPLPANGVQVPARLITGPGPSEAVGVQLPGRLSVAQGLETWFGILSRKAHPSGGAPARSGSDRDDHRVDGPLVSTPAQI